jgi:hypothetical protein
VIINSLLFAFIAYGITMVITLCVAAIIKGIAFAVQRGGKRAAAGAEKK